MVFLFQTSAKRPSLSAKTDRGRRRCTVSKTKEGSGLGWVYDCTRGARAKSLPRECGLQYTYAHRGINKRERSGGDERLDASRHLGLHYHKMRDTFYTYVVIPTVKILAWSSLDLAHIHHHQSLLSIIEPI